MPRENLLLLWGRKGRIFAGASTAGSLPLPERLVLRLLLVTHCMEDLSAWHPVVLTLFSPCMP